MISEPFGRRWWLVAVAVLLVGILTCYVLLRPSRGTQEVEPAIVRQLVSYAHWYAMRSGKLPADLSDFDQYVKANPDTVWPARAAVLIRSGRLKARYEVRDGKPVVSFTCKGKRGELDLSL